MIKRTFYNLPAEKREKIIDITRKEFQKGNKQKITINSVIKKAGISRGSFYQYFDDKLDLVELITDDMTDRMAQFIQNELMLNGGDIFEIPMRIFDLMTSDRERYSDLAMLTDTSNQNSALISDYMQYRAHHRDIIGGFERYINKSQLEYSSKDDIECIVFMMFDAIMAAMYNVTKNGSDIEHERRGLYRKIQIIKNGAVKRA